ncbi:MAG: calcineurin-like phosphoesterase C-terminal domain-containing protein [Bacteroidales bacterium]|nr:calcineurin-like phosphoesterase C-terminal domain-containing protein [Bacteroidales bacterium]
MKKIISILTCVFIVAVASGRTPKGTNVYGQVLCDGAPMKGVVVSDGVELTMTDGKGFYYLKSDKREGSVFVSIPSCTEVDTECGMPRFWQPLSGDKASVERHDFQLRKVDNSKFALLAVSDIHLANVHDDMRQFRDIFMPRLREEVAKYTEKGIPVYCINGGDTSYDRYWYEYLYTIRDVPGTLRDVDFPVPMFHIMGNHDNDGAVFGVGDVDFAAAQAYRETMGPTRYSFNIGKAHFIVLDNIVYRNDEGRIDTYEGIAGRRNYETYLREDALEWLKKDLATVTDKSCPVVVGMHAPAFAYKDGTPSSPIYSRFRREVYSPDDMLNEFSALFKGFSQVHLITGHTHKNKPCHGADDTSKFPYIANIIDHNITGVCGVWWMTECYGGLSFAEDSAPSGFETFTFDGDDVRWYFVSNDDGAQQQFRVFDMNSVRDYWRTDGEVRVFMKHYPDKSDFSCLEDDLVCVHVWAWESGWSISVTENGKPLAVEECTLENPQFTINYLIPKTLWEDNEPTRFPSKYAKPQKNRNFFFVHASGPDTTLEVKVTDCFGNEWTQTVTRPKPFGKLMK